MPRRAASRAMPAPVMPPPTTSSSTSAPGRALKVASRVSGDSGSAMWSGFPALALTAVQLGEESLGLRDLVGPPLLTSDLERAGCEGESFVPLATLVGQPGERQAGGEGARILLEHTVQHRLTPDLISAEEPRQAHQQLTLGGERVGVLGVELERPVELAHHPVETEYGGDP